MLLLGTGDGEDALVEVFESVGEVEFEVFFHVKDDILLILLFVEEEDIDIELIF